MSKITQYIPSGVVLLFYSIEFEYDKFVNYVIFEKRYSVGDILTGLSHKMHFGLDVVSSFEASLNNNNKTKHVRVQ